MNKWKEQIKYAHLQIEKDNKKIIYTIHDMCGALKTTTNKEDLKHYIKIYNIKIVDICHINYNLDCNNIAF